MFVRQAIQTALVFLMLGGLAWIANAQDRDRGDRDRGDRDRDDGREADMEGRRGDDISPRLLPPRPDRPDRDGSWYLGVEVDYTNYGAVVTNVVRNSPARRAGLETRDVIVTVNGYQVGDVNGRMYRLERELELRADRRGNVTLLVQNRRNGQLTPIPVQLEPFRDRDDGPKPFREGLILGTIDANNAGQLAPNAVLTVRLMDVTDRRVPPRQIAQTSKRDLGPFPIPFELDYDPARIQSGRSYALDAQVTVNGLASLRTRDRYPISASGRTERVRLELEPARR